MFTRSSQSSQFKRIYKDEAKNESTRELTLSRVGLLTRPSNSRYVCFCEPGLPKGLSFDVVIHISKTMFRETSLKEFSILSISHQLISTIMF